MQENMQEKEVYRRVDFNIIISVVFLSIFGLIMLFSSSMDQEMMRSQAVYLVVGFILMLAAQFLNYEWLKPIAFLGYIGSIGLILLLKVPGLAYSAYDATRWVVIGGVMIQIVEPVKLLMIVFLAHYITKHLFEINSLKGVIKVWLMVSVIALMVLKISSNLSSCLILLMITFCMTFISSNTKWFHGAVFVAAIAAVILIYWYFTKNSPSAAELAVIKKQNYQLARIIGWTNPEKYMDVNTYQVMQGLYAIGSGGFFGKGIGQSVQKQLLPEAQNDMIVCIIAEELGILGVAVLIFLYAYLLYHIMLVAYNTKDTFGRLICAGVMFHFAFQVLVNVGVATAIIPNTGVTLPFVSAGGSAVLMAFVQITLVLSVYRREKKRVEKRMKKRKRSDMIS